VQVKTDNVFRTVFQQQWWLESVTGGQYCEVAVRSGNVTQGWLPYVTRRRWGYLVSGMPFLTHALGPIILPGTGSATSEFLRHNSITSELLAQLPKLAHFRQVLPPDDSTALGFAEYGCHIGVQFTFITDCGDLEAVWQNMRDKTRNLIRSSEEKNVIVADATPEEFLRLYAEHRRERKQINHYENSRARETLELGISRDQGRIYLCRDRVSGVVNAGIAVIWDSRDMYFLMSTRSTRADSGAVSLLLWNAMQEANRRGLRFDFDGVYNLGSYRFLSGFGGTLARRHVVEKFSPLYHALDRVRAKFYGNMENPYGA
jgi:hypothetical protein